MRLENGFYNPMYDRAHVDEKWFYRTEGIEFCYVGRNEDDPVSIGNRGHIEKVMFIAAVARPRFDPNTHR
jgi:hypothetical protein